jgi:hypothetical protein
MVNVILSKSFSYDFELIWPMKRLVGCLLNTMMYQEWVKIEENPP